MTRRPPLVTVGLPVYNGETYLRECLASLSAQTWPHLEIVVSDNASTDGTVRICEAFAVRDPRIRLLRSSVNRGAVWNHNTVLEAARGSYFKWFAADDVALPRFIEACVDALERDRRAVLAYPLAEVIDEHGQVTDRTRDRMPLDDPDPAVRFAQVLDAMHVTQNPFYGLVRTDVLRRARPVGTFLANDRCLVAELSLFGPFVRVEEYLMRRRITKRHEARTRDEEQRMMSPAARGYWTRDWRILFEHLRSALTAPLDARTRLGTLRALTRWAWGCRMNLVWEAREVVEQGLRRVRPRSSRARRPDARARSRGESIDVTSS